jgi:hypothetical protein
MSYKNNYNPIICGMSYQSSDTLRTVNNPIFM